MSSFDGPISRRAAMATLGKAGAGLFALSSSGSYSSGEQQRNDVPDRFSTALAGFSAESRSKLRAFISSNNFSGQIPASTVQDLVASEHKSVAAVMLALLSL